MDYFAKHVEETSTMVRENYYAKVTVIASKGKHEKKNQDSRDTIKMSHPSGCVSG